MYPTEALTRATALLQHQPFTDADAAALFALEAEHRGISSAAAEKAYASLSSSPQSTEATVCDDVNYWAKIRWGIEADQIIRPTALAKLVDLLLDARSERTTVRMVGAARSDSLASTPGAAAMVASCGMDSPLPVLTAALADGADPKTLYRCESGRRAKDVIDDLQAAGLALQNMGSGQFHGIVGAIMTSTHGSGLKLKDMSGLTVAMQIVRFDAEGNVVVRQLARKGIFDPDKFAAAVADSPIPIELSEDEDEFLAAVVSMGCLGLVYSVTLRGMPQYWLQESRTVARWSQLKTVLLKEAASIRNYEVLVSPHLRTFDDGSEDHECLVTRRVLVDATEPSGSRPLSMWISQTPIGHAVAGTTLVVATTSPLDVVPWMLHTGVTATQVVSYTEISRKVLQLNLDLNAVGSELEVPVEKTVQAVDTLLEMAQENWLEMKRRLDGEELTASSDKLQAAWREVPLHTSPISLRFVGPEDAMLSMAHGGARCMIEMPMPGSTHFDRAIRDGTNVFEQGLLDLYEAYLDGRNTLYRATESRLREQVGARPHWGLVNFITAEQAKTSYARWGDWLGYYQTANQFGVLNNPMTDAMGLSIDPPGPPGPDEPVTGTAIFHSPEGGLARLTLLGDLGRTFFDELTSPTEARKGLCGKKRMGADLLASTTGKDRTELRFTAGNLADPAGDWSLASPRGTPAGTAVLLHGVLTIEGDAGSALRAFLVDGGAELPDSSVLNLHVLDMARGRLSLLTSG